MMGEHELRPARAAAGELALLLGTAVRVVPAEGVGADRQRADPPDQLVDLRFGPRCRDGQDMSPPAPAMNPSSDIVAEQSTVANSSTSRRC